MFLDQVFIKPEFGTDDLITEVLQGNDDAACDMVTALRWHRDPALVRAALFAALEGLGPDLMVFHETIEDGTQQYWSVHGINLQTHKLAQYCRPCLRACSPELKLSIISLALTRSVF